MNVSSVKNLNGEVFSAVQDAYLTNVVQTNSAQWAEGGGGSTFDPTYMSAQIDNKLNKSEIGFIKVNSIDYVSGISGKNISAKFADRANTANNAFHATTASYDDNGNSLTTTYYSAQEANNKVNDLFNFVQSNSANWEGGSSPAVDNKVLFYKNYSYDPSYGSQNIDTFVSGATELYFEAAVDSQQSTPSEIVFYRNGNEIGRANWSQVSSDGSYNYLTASYNNDDGGNIQIQNYNGTNYSNFVVSANGVKTLVFYQDSYDCATDKEVKFNINGFNIVGQINGWLQGNITPLTSFTGGLTDFTAKGYNKYDTNITYEDSNNSYNYNVSAEFGGSEVPSGTMNVSGLEYNAVNEISAYNGSAIAQYGAEKQWLQHDDTIVHVANSAQYAFGVNISAVAQLLGVDETVLWENSTGTYCISGSDTFVLNEPASAFKKLQFTVTDNIYKSYNLSYIDSTITSFDLTSLDTVDANTFAIRKARVSTNDYTNYTIGDFVRVNFANNSTINYAGYYGARITKVVGIGRKS